jgi:hypothetical protein
MATRKWCITYLLNPCYVGGYFETSINAAGHYLNIKPFDALDVDFLWEVSIGGCVIFIQKTNQALERHDAEVLRGDHLVVTPLLGYSLQEIEASQHF